MTDIFISYSQKDRSIAKRLADFLTHEGYDVWWDTELVGGSKFRHEINTHLVKAKASIVIWTPNSVESEWVVEEAEEAKHDDKLLATRTEDVDYRAIPLGFRSIQTDLITEPDRLLRALKNKGVLPSRAGSATAGQRHDAIAIVRAEQIAHWEFIKESDDPADFARFIAKYPDSNLVELAQKRLNVLAPPPPPPPPPKPEPAPVSTYTPPVYRYEPEYPVERRRWPWVVAIIVVLGLAALGASERTGGFAGPFFGLAGIGLALLVPIWLLVRFRSVRMLTMIGMGTLVSGYLLPVLLGIHWTHIVPGPLIPALDALGRSTYNVGQHVVIAATVIVPLWILLRVRRGRRRRRY